MVLYLYCFLTRTDILWWLDWSNEINTNNLDFLVYILCTCPLNKSLSLDNIAYILFHRTIRYCCFRVHGHNQLKVAVFYWTLSDICDISQWIAQLTSSCLTTHYMDIGVHRTFIDCRKSAEHLAMDISTLTHAKMMHHF